MSHCEFHMVGDRIGTTDFKFYPDSPVQPGILQQHIGPGSKTEYQLLFFRQYRNLTGALPADGRVGSK